MQLPFCTLEDWSETEAKPTTIVKTLVNSMPIDGTAFLAPFVPVTDSMAKLAINLANLQENDVLCDLGCGDGGIIRSGLHVCRCIGVELDPHLALSVRSEFAPEIDSGRLIFYEMDFHSIELIAEGVTCLILYLLPEALTSLDAKFKQWLNVTKGGRIVSVVYQIPGWKAAEKALLPKAELHYYDRTSFL